MEPSITAPLGSNHSMYSNNPNSHHLNGSRGGQHHQDDAIVPASEDELPDESTDEDEEEYNSYLQQQEQKQHRDISHEDEYLHQQQRQQQQHLHAYKSQAMNIQQLLRQEQQQEHDEDEDMDLDSEDEFGPHDHDQYDHDHERQDTLLDDEDDDSFDDERGPEDALDEMMEEDDEEDDEGSETISLTEDDIDFNLVYAFHTFVATQEGQASVVRNDSLMLLEDTNVYWWLVRVLKTGVIGYIPAENIETPFERLARLNTYRNVALSAPTAEWGTFDEHVQPLDPAILAQRSMNRRSVIFTAQNDYLEASETEWTDEEDENGDWYEDGEEEDEEEGDEDEDQEDDDEFEEELEELEADDDMLDDEDEYDGEDMEDVQHIQLSTGEQIQEPAKTSLQLEAERVQREILNDQMALKAHTHHMAQGHQEPHLPEQDEEPEGSEDEEVQVTNQYRKPLLDEVDLMFANTEPRVISLTPPIARDDNLTSRVQTPPGKPKPYRRSSEEQPSTIIRRLSGSSPLPSHIQTSSPAPTSTKSFDARSPSFDSEEEDRDKTKKKQEERTTAKLNALLGKNNTPAPRLTKEEYEAGLPPEAPVVKKPGKFKSLFGVGKSSKEKERKEKERLEKERLKNLAKNSQTATSITSNNSLFRTRSNSNGSVGTQISTNTTSSIAPLSPTSPLDKSEPHQQEILTLRVYPGNVDFGASMYKTVVVTPTTMASDVAHQAVIKFRLAPDGTASTGDFFLTVRGVDGDETVLQPTDKPMTIYQSLTAHLTTPLPTNHRLSISSVSSMMSVNSTSSHNSYPQTLRRTGSKGEQQQRSIRFLLNKKIRRANSISVSSLPATPTTPTTPQEDFFWVKVVCQAQDLPQCMLLLDGMGTALEKSNPRALGQSLATKVEHWIPMHATSNAGDVIFKTLERVGIRSGVVDGVPEHVLVAKRTAVPNGLVIEYQLGLKLNGTSSPKNKQGDEVPLAPQVPLIKCFEDHQLIPVRRSPKADVASMPLHPDHTFFLRKAPKSLQAEMKFVQEQLMMQQQRPAPRKAPAPLQAQASRSGDSDNSAQPSPTGMSPRGDSGQGRSDASSPPPQNRSINQAFAGGRMVGGAASPIRIPRRTDSVILNPTSPIRGNSFDSGRPSPTLSTQSLITTQAIPHPQMSRTPTPDHAGMGSRARSPSAQGTSPGSLRGLQAPSPAPSNLSSNMGASGTGDQEGSRSSTPERPTRFDRNDRQRATSPPLTHGPSPLSLSAIMHDDPTSPSPLSASTERPGFFSKNSFSAGESPSFHQHKNLARFNVKKNAGQGVDIVLNKGVIRSQRTQSSPSSLPSVYYRYTFLPLEGEEEIDVSEIMEDILGGDESDSDVDQDEQQDQGLAGMSRRERAAAAVARASKLVAASKERRRASASSQSNLSTSLATKSSKWADRDRLEFLASSPRGGDTLMKLERALTGDEASASGGRGSILNGRNLPSPMSLNSASATPSPSQNRRSSDTEIQSAVVGSRNQSPMPTVIVEGKTSLHGEHTSSSLPRRLQTPSPSPSPSSRPPISIQTAVAPSSGPSSATVTRSSSGSPSYAMSRTRSASASVAEISRLDTRLGLSRGSPSSPSRATPISPTTVITHSNDPWLLSSDYNTGMQDMLTLVRGGRSSSVSHIHSSSSLSSTHSSRGLVIGKDGKIVPSHQSTLSSPSSLSSMNSTFSRNDGRANKAQHLNTTNNTTKDTQSDERSSNTSNDRGPYEHFDDNNNTHHTRNEPSSPSASPSSPTSLNTFNSGRAGSSVQDQETSSSSRIWTRTDLRLRDVRRDCHPEVFECWRDVDADLEKVERELNSLLATVKATTF
ncbi:hypothetical protein BGZ52_001090 [Haplosporangium bisporale]|nr:hypothetical protein BGZ52_001090 [Haplosporangium bisporale]